MIIRLILAGHVCLANSWSINDRQHGDCYGPEMNLEDQVFSLETFELYS
jgi:hypothetical protein